jgi:hypothetical protein
LMSEDIDHSASEGWCRKCWAPKPERTRECCICTSVRISVRQAH